MKTILVPLGGGQTDEAGLAMGLALARPVGGHLELFHVHIDAAEAARHIPYAGFVQGSAIGKTLRALGDSADARAQRAEKIATEFCARHALGLTDRPADRHEGVTAHWRKEKGDALDRLVAHARHRDVVVVSRPAKPDGLPMDRVETLLLESGRPLVLPGTRVAPDRFARVAILWKETPSSARALAAACPLLSHAARIDLIGMSEQGIDPRPALEDVANQLDWQGIAAHLHVVDGGRRPEPARLIDHARALDADLIVMGGYGRRRLREIVFGGLTQTVLDGPLDLPVFMMH